jgi:hypothetical protein
MSISEEMTESRFEKICEDLSSLDVRIRLATLSSLVDEKSSLAPFGNYLAELLRHEDSEIRIRTAWLLSSRLEDIPHLIAQLSNLIFDPDPRVRFWTLRAVGQSCVPLSLQLKIFNSALEDTDPKNKEEAITKLFQVFAEYPFEEMQTK